jgi:hypothetical protein
MNWKTILGAAAGAVIAVAPLAASAHQGQTWTTASTSANGSFMTQSTSSQVLTGTVLGTSTQGNPHHNHRGPVIIVLNGFSNMGLHLGSILGWHGGNDTSTWNHGHHDGDHRNHDGDDDHDATTTPPVATTTQQIVASTTAARITAKANRLGSIADTMSAFSTTLSSRIASSSLSTSSVALSNTLLGDYNGNVANAKTNVSNALSVAGQINASTTSTSTQVLAGEARSSLQSAREFIRSAEQDLRHILSILLHG